MPTKSKIKKAIQAGLLFLVNEQREDGGFDCEASTDSLNFSHSIAHKIRAVKKGVLCTML